ncbi:MAG: hypothetical protein ISS95_00190 [Candidatus Aenigmarchaeota archaeon]|nr:hypothetical protein [Candidatus Aenigmarchaeota archaeon]
MDFENVRFGEIKADEKYSEPEMMREYSWLEGETGFYPLFLAVGGTEEDILMSGYGQNWQRIIGSKPIGKDERGFFISKNILRKKGEFPNKVLFSFEEIEGVFMDYDYWHLVLNSEYKNYQMTEYEKKLIFKYSWPKSKWLKKAGDELHTVQLVTGKLYLPDAKRIRVRNKKTKRRLREMGFEGVEVKRIMLGDYYH